MADVEQGKTGDESMRTIIIALIVNILVAIIKAVAGVLTASAGLLAEAAHSVGDCTTELFLVTAVRRSDKPADRRHPFGYGKERYFWSLLAALTIFVLGAGFSVYQGLSTIIEGEADSSAPIVGYVVIALSAVVEGLSLRQATRQAKTASKRARMSVHAYVKDPDDPTVKSVVVEDSAALIGLAIAAGIAATSEPGKRFFAFGRESVAETKKVVWPTRKETIQTTAVVFGFVMIMAISIWGVDKIIEFIVYDLFLGWRK